MDSRIFSKVSPRMGEIMGVEHFGIRLAEERGRVGLTQAALAEKTNGEISPRSIASLERGAYEPSWGVVVALAKALGIKTDAFLKAPVDVNRPKKRGRPPKVKPVDGK